MDTKLYLTKKNGTLHSLKHSKGEISITGGAVPAGALLKLTDTKWGKAKMELRFRKFYAITIQNE